MLNGKGWNGLGFFARAALIVFGILGVRSAIAAEPQCYNLASLQGNYAVITNYGDNVAKAFGVRYYDGNGHFTGSFTINEPKSGSTTGERTIVSGGTQTGTYTVNCDGTGVVNRVVTLPDGTTAMQSDDFVITGAAVSGPPGRFFAGQLIATALVDAGRDPSPIVSGGLFVTHKYSRLPDRQTPQQ